MPTYEYRCRGCGHEFERFQKISDPPVRTCPECGKRRVERLISKGGGLVFKGPGFYATDYRKPAPSGEGSGSESPSKSESGSEGGSSSKSGSKSTKEGGSGKDAGA